MEVTINNLQERKTIPARITRSSKLYKSIINAIQDKKGEDIVSLDLKKIDEAVADFFVICDGRSNTHVNAIADNIIEHIINECNEKPYHVEFGEKWTIVDYVNIVVHIFQQEQRLFYNLESLWEDAPKFEM